MATITANTHDCQYRHDQGPCATLLSWWLLPAHFITSTALALALLLLVDQRSFLVKASDTRENSNSTTFKLYQSDVTTLISVALVLIRIASGSWLALTGWRMSFIVLERNGATLSELSRMINYRIPPITFHHRGQPRQQQSNMLLPAMWLILLLAMPSTLVSPLLTGAVSWIPNFESGNPTSIINITTAGQGERWRQYNMYANNRFYEVLGAFGLSSIATTKSYSPNSTSIFRRRIPSISGTAINSTLAKATIPYFDIESLDWVMSVDQLGDDTALLQAVIGDPHYPALNISNSRNPFNHGTDSGRLTLVNEVPWVPAPYLNDSVDTFVYPNATLQHASKWVIVATHFRESCASGPTYFGESSEFYHYDGAGGCFLFARINYTAGVLTCTNCPIVLDSIVEADSSTSNSTSPWTAEPDAMVEQAIALMPEVLFYMKIGNTSNIPLWHNLDGYTRGMLSVAYQASWNSLTTDFQANDTTTVLSPQYPVLVASITRWRVLLWLLLNASLTVSGVILAVLQISCQAKTIQNPPLSALMIDTSAVLQEDRNGLCNAAYADKRDAHLRLRLVVPGRTAETYGHPFLKVEGEAADEVLLDQLLAYGSEERPVRWTSRD